MRSNLGHILRPAAPMPFPRHLAESSAGMANLMSEQATGTLPDGVPRDARGGTPGMDPLHGPFLGGEPTGTGDVILTALFLALFAAGAFTHMTIFKANRKRGHKFIFNQLLFELCAIRILTCVFRIAWVFSKLRGVVLAAQIFQSAGAVIIFAVNLVFTQRILCAMHPTVGWHPIARKIFLFLVISIPAVTVLNIISLSFFFFSVQDFERHEMTERLLIFGGSWNLTMSLLPLIIIFIACATPGPPAEQFGQGALVTKATILVFVAAMSAAGAAVRLAVVVNPISGLLGLSLFDRSVFYITGFTFEILAIIIYAYFRIDILFHIPDGASKQGDYAAGAKRPERGQPWTVRELERELARLGIRYDRLQSRWGAKGGQLLLRFYPTLNSKACPQQDFQGSASSADPTSSRGGRDASEFGEVATESI
ncbi:hypothetical protein CP532_4969 [Ophiocordyceps camponoti-leonardi (nom. inval.)]|nr:hypothetical protein CP532_4969 [Ophiocordyceps camponoti-leonardi (nom. inval.)]